MIILSREKRALSPFLFFTKEGTNIPIVVGTFLVSLKKTYSTATLPQTPRKKEWFLRLSTF